MPATRQADLFALPSLLHFAGKDYRGIESKVRACREASSVRLVLESTLQDQCLVGLLATGCPWRLKHGLNPANKGMESHSLV